MSQKESGPAANRAVPDYLTRLSPIGSAGTAHLTSAAPVAHRVRYLHTLAHVLTRTRFHGSTTQGQLYYSIVDDPTGRRLGAVMILPILSIVGWCSSSLRGSHVV